MHTLPKLLAGIAVQKIMGHQNVQIKAICFDSREVSPATLFVAIPGTRVDGHAYIPQAIAAGSKVIVCTQLPQTIVNHVTYVVVAHSAQALGILAANFYDNPAAKLHLVAVTGTNGKTSTVQLLYGLFKQLGYQVGMLSTMHNKIGDLTLPASYTTPHPIQLHQLLARMVAQGCQYCFIEASSHALVQERIAGLRLAGAVFLNITHDHLDYHRSFAAYMRAKQKLFTGLSTQAFALFNADDKRGLGMVQNTKASKYPFALKTPATFTAKLLANTLHGLELRIAGQSTWFQLIGTFNAYNLLAAYATACLLGVASYEALIALSTLPPICGRFQCLHTKQGFVVIIDYAHTPDALKKVLTTIKQIKSKPSKVITVVGCGGDRDPQKRPRMGQTAYQLSDQVIFTSDNPRSEDPQAIITAMQAGLSKLQQQKTWTMLDRAEAIKAACLVAKRNDVVLIAGKGHERYQEIQGKKLPFEDKQVVTAMVELDSYFDCHENSRL